MLFWCGVPLKKTATTGDWTYTFSRALVRSYFPLWGSPSKSCYLRAKGLKGRTVADSSNERKVLTEGEAIRREQKTGKPGYPCGEPLETGRRKGARSIATLETAGKNGASVLRRLGNITKRYMTLHASY